MKTIYDALKISDFLTVKKMIQEERTLLDQEDEQGATLLAYAIKARSDNDIIYYLIEVGSDIAAIDNEGVNILEYAITYGNIAVAKRLIEQGVSPKRTQRQSGFTPLMAAVSYNHYELVALFLEQGVELLARDRSGFTAIDFARRMHRKKILAFLEQYVQEHGLIDA